MTAARSAARQTLSGRHALVIGGGISGLASALRAEGREPTRLQGRWRDRFFRDGVALALQCDPVVYRAFLRMMNMLETPEQAFSRPEVLTRCLWVLYRSESYKQRVGYRRPPDSEPIIARCEAAAADRHSRSIPAAFVTSPAV